MSLTVQDITPALMLAFGKRASVIRIQEEVADFYGVASSYMREPDGIGVRDRRVCRPRQVAMMLATELTGLPLMEIGRRFGGRDHTTVIHARKVIQRLFITEPRWELEVELLREALSFPQVSECEPRLVPALTCDKVIA